MLTYEQQTQVHHIARLAVLAMCARGVAASEFENPEVMQVVLRINRDTGAELPVDVEYLGTSGTPLGGMAI